MAGLGAKTRTVVYATVIKGQLDLILKNPDDIPQAGDSAARNFQFRKDILEIRPHIGKLKMHLASYPKGKKCADHADDPDHEQLRRLYEELARKYDQVLQLMQAKGHKTNELALPVPSSS